jgi:hypothetical protein
MVEYINIPCGSGIYLSIPCIYVHVFVWNHYVNVAIQLNISKQHNSDKYKTK